MTPRRIQLRRTKGWRMPADTVKADRTTIYGNPFKVGDQHVPDAAEAKRMFTARMPGRTLEPPHPESRLGRLIAALPALQGKNIACWCRLCDRHRDGKPAGEECDDCAPCHVDTLLILSNP